MVFIPARIRVCAACKPWVDVMRLCVIVGASLNTCTLNQLSEAAKPQAWLTRQLSFLSLSPSVVPLPSPLLYRPPQPSRVSKHLCALCAHCVSLLCFPSCFLLSWAEAGFLFNNWRNQGSKRCHALSSLCISAAWADRAPTALPAAGKVGEHCRKSRKS